MCNAYRITPKLRGIGLDEQVSAEISRLPSELVRRTGPGVVVTLHNSGELVPATMRWGFPRQFGNAINNARADNLHSAVWKDALGSRRCLVPISIFYEWQPLPQGRKQAFEFRREDGDWMWIAGLWEQSEKFGPCYATITTEPSALVEPIHDRMLAVVDFDHGLKFLDGDDLPFAPYAGAITADACESPLKQRKPPDDPVQGTLF